MLNKQSRTADKWWFYTWGLGRRPTSPHREEPACWGVCTERTICELWSRRVGKLSALQWSRSRNRLGESEFVIPCSIVWQRFYCCHCIVIFMKLLLQIKEWQKRRWSQPVVFNPLKQPFPIFLPWRNPWNNFQVSGNPCIKIIIYTAHGTLAWSVNCRYNNEIIIVSALLSRELYFSVDLFILANKFKKRCLFFSVTISRGTSSDISRNPCWETLLWSVKLIYIIFNITVPFRLLSSLHGAYSFWV
jgi:hypothetical protein